MNTIGRIDKVDFPMLGLSNIPVKIDTGAYTSSIHCHKIKVVDEKLECTFEIFDFKKKLVFSEFSTKIVKSSNGIAEARYRIKADIKLFDKRYPIYLTLSKRGEMRFPVLLGRRFLKRKCLVDVSLINQSYLYQAK